MARDLIRWDPFDDFRTMRRVFDRAWQNPLVQREDVEFGLSEEMLPVEIFEKGNDVIVKAALPGVDPKDVHIDVTDNVLNIRAETKGEVDIEEASYHRREFRYGRCSRSFRLPPNLDANKAKAKFENGLLRLTIPKTEAAKPKAIQIELKG